MKTTVQGDERFLSSDIFEVKKEPRTPRRDGGTWSERGRDIGIYHRCDVLVVGGGPAGTAAAAAAAATGADVTLLERYNHLGGLSTGGLVIWIDRMTDWDGRPTIRGFAEELMTRLPPDGIAGPSPGEWGSRDPLRAAYWAQRTAAFHGMVTWSPTIDPERLKLLSQQILIERGVRLVYHSWAAAPIVEDNTVRGVVFESKEGRQAILAKVVIDCTGDGDMFARAGAPTSIDVDQDDVHHCMNTSWLFAGVDMTRWIEFKVGQPEQFSQFTKAGREALGLFERPFVSWRNDVALFMGPRQTGYSGLNVDDLTEVEVRSHKLMAAHLDFYRTHAPGFEGAFMMLSAPQLGVRHTRRLVGSGSVLREDWPTARVHADEIGVTPAVSPKFPNISIPYGCLVPRSLNGLLAAGRHISCDRNSHGFMREIPQCWVTGQAAGVAASLSVSQGVAPRAVEIGAVQDELLRQGVVVRKPERKVADTTAHKSESTAA
ncbi:FAD-dependent oxidoreductase [Variovorax gossypii]